MAIEPSLSSIALARRWAAKLLRAAGISGRTLEILVLLVSEAVTNAVAHAVPPASMHLTIRNNRARVEVYDCAHDVPVIQSPSPADVGGRGVGLIDLLAGDWGVTRCEGNPDLKLVWFELDLT